MQAMIVLDNIRSTYNVGAILRTAEGFGVKGVLLSGYTPRVHDASLLPHLRDKLDKQIHKTALGAEDMLDIESVENIRGRLEQLKRDGWQIVGLENNISSRKVYRLDDKELGRKLKSKVLLILGEEVQGIDYSLHDIIDLFIEIPMKGQKESFNVSVAAGIAIYGIMNL